jgi:bis(5'-nucleosyl)-tetraphosphatase (symmetrical)
MATYIIGDVQGCFDELQSLLSLIKYREDRDALWFTGDLVNRGSKSLEVLRFVKNLPDVICVLGNHDLSLLALAFTQQPLHDHTLEDVLTAPDSEELLQWLLQLPLIYTHPTEPYTVVHAGIPPQWSLTEARRYALEVENILKGPASSALLRNMFGSHPLHWDENLEGWDRCRYIINALTRLRFCERDGSLNLSYKGSLEDAPPTLIPWFNFENRKTRHEKILFGHWAALMGKVSEANIYPLDTGCVWGGTLTALRLEDERLFSVSCAARRG